MLFDLENYQRLCFFCKIQNREYNTCNSPAVVFEAMTLFHRNFQGLLINLSPIKPEILISTKLFWLQRNCSLSSGIFLLLSHPVHKSQFMLARNNENIRQVIYTVFMVRTLDMVALLLITAMEFKSII